MDIIWKYAVSSGSVAVALVVSYSRLVVSQFHIIFCVYCKTSGFVSKARLSCIVLNRVHSEPGKPAK